MKSDIKYGNPKIIRQLREEQELNKKNKELKHSDINDNFAIFSNQDNFVNGINDVVAKDIPTAVVAEDITIDSKDKKSSLSDVLIEEVNDGTTVIEHVQDLPVLSKKSKVNVVKKSKKVKSVQVYNPDEKILKKLKSEYGFGKSGAYKFALLQLSKNLNLF